MSGLRREQGEHLLGHYLKIGRDGRVTVAVPQAETGQGIWTTLPQLLADELGAAWEMVGVEPAPLLPEYANPLASEEGWLDGFGPLRQHRLTNSGMMRVTAGSTSMRAFEMPFRQAGAAAREMLIAAAASRWGVDARECDTADGFALHGSQRLGFGELAEAAARHTPPSDPRLRQASQRRLAGQPLPRLDLPPKSDGSFRFAGDVRLPDMLFAAARVVPPGGRLTAFSREAAETVPGVRGVIARRGWLAVVADNGWAAQRGLDAASARFRGRSSLDASEVRALCEAAMDGADAETTHRRGDYSAAVRGRTTLTADYWIAPTRHLALEPRTATARWRGATLEVWAPTIAAGLARQVAADASGLTAADINLYPMPPGEPSGTVIEAPAVPIAVELARTLRRPVQVGFPQLASQNLEAAAPPVLARIFALPGASAITAWRMRVATADGLGAALARLTAADRPQSIHDSALRVAVPSYGIGNVSVDSLAVDLPFATGYLRSFPASAFAFATESFIDELARATGGEPLAFRMALLGRNVRLANCIARSAALGGWDGGGRGSTMGLAACSAFGSHIGLLADASLGDGQKVQVHRLVAVVDCGRVANPQIVRQQIEGGLIWGLGQATSQPPHWRGGMPLAVPFEQSGLPRLRDTPRIQVELVASRADPGGVSGLGAVPIAAAVANAIYAGTGRRLRSLPFDPMSAG